MTKDGLHTLTRPTYSTVVAEYSRIWCSLCFISEFMISHLDQGIVMVHATIFYQTVCFTTQESFAFKIMGKTISRTLYVGHITVLTVATEANSVKVAESSLIIPHNTAKILKHASLKRTEMTALAAQRFWTHRCKRFTSFAIILKGK